MILRVVVKERFYCSQFDKILRFPVVGISEMKQEHVEVIWHSVTVYSFVFVVVFSVPFALVPPLMSSFNKHLMQRIYTVHYLHSSCFWLLRTNGDYFTNGQ